MDKAQTTEEITALIMELPDRGPAITKDDPRVFYHRTADDFSTFNLYHQNRKDAGWLGRGATPPQHSPCRKVCQSKGWVSESDCHAAFPHFRLELGLWNPSEYLRPAGEVFADTNIGKSRA